MKKRASLENIKIAFRSIKSQLLRTVLTIMIIAIGITALVGILTAIDSIKAAINKEFAIMGANTFSVRNRGTRVQVGKRGKKPKRYKVISTRRLWHLKMNTPIPPEYVFHHWHVGMLFSNTKTGKRIQTLLYLAGMKTI